MKNQYRSQSTVLIADDEYHFNVEVLGYHFKRIGYNTLSAFTVEQFIDQALNADAIILDIRMPDKEGEAINPWGGLQALNKFASLGSEKFEAILAKTIIRSAHSISDATRAKETVPQGMENRWFAVDRPLSDIINAVDSITSSKYQSREYCNG